MKILCAFLIVLCSRYVMAGTTESNGLFAVKTVLGQAVFSKVTGNLLSLTDVQNRELYNGQANPNPFTVDVYPGDTRLDLSYHMVSPSAGKFTERNGEGIWQFVLDDDVTAELRAGPGPQGSIKLDLRLKNAGRRSVALKPCFPKLNGLPAGSGVKLYYPMFTGQCLNNLGGNPLHVEMVYPLQMASQWVTVADERGYGIAFGAFDADMRQVTYDLDVEKPGAPLAVSRHFAKQLKPGESWELTPFLLRPFAGDWHAGAKPYRDWFLANVPVRPPETYLDQSQGFYFCSMMDFGDYSHMPWQLDMARALGIRATCWWAQGADLIGQCPAASPVQGGVDMFRAMNQQAKAGGLTTGYYFNKQLYPRPTVVGSKWMNAQPMDELEPSAQRPPLLLTRELERDLEVRPLNGDCAYGGWVKMPTARHEWIRHLEAWARRYLTVYGADHIYLDQFSYSDNEWVANMPDGSIAAETEGHKRLANILQELAAEIPGRHFFPSEGFGELAQRCLGYGLWASTKNASTDPGGYQLGKQARQMPDYGHFLLPWGNWFEFRNDASFPDRMAVYDAVLYNVLDIGCTVYITPQTPADLLYLPRQVRRDFNLLWSGAWYQDTLGVEKAPSGLNVRTYQGDPRLGRFEFAALTVEEAFQNAPPVGGALVLAPQTLKAVNSVWLFTKDHAAPLAFRLENGKIQVTLPALRVGYVLMVEQLPALLRLDKLPWDAETESSLNVPATLFRWLPGQTNTQFTLTLNGRPQEVGVPAGDGPSATKCSIPLRLPRAFDADNLVEIRQRASSDHEHVLGYVSSPPPVRAKMYASCARQELILTLENPTSREQQYALSLTLPNGLSWSAGTPPATVVVPAGERRELRFGLAGIRELDWLAWIRGAITPAHGKAVPIFASAQTPLYDTSFEHCVAADGKFGFSEFWHRVPEGFPADIPLSYLGIYLDTARVHFGKQSLRFDPQRKSPQAGVFSLLGRLEVGHRYKLSAWFYREHPEDSLLVQTSAGQVSISPQPSDPVGAWFKLETTVTARNELAPPMPFLRSHMYLLSQTPLKGPVWLDDVKMEVIE